LPVLLPTHPRDAARKDLIWRTAVRRSSARVPRPRARRAPRASKRAHSGCRSCHPAGRLTSYAGRRHNTDPGEGGRQMGCDPTIEVEVAKKKGGQPAQAAARMPGAGPGRANSSVGWVVGTAPQYWFGGNRTGPTSRSLARHSSDLHEPAVDPRTGRTQSEGTRHRSPRPGRLDGEGSTMVKQAGRQRFACVESEWTTPPQTRILAGPPSPESIDFPKRCKCFCPKRRAFSSPTRPRHGGQHPCVGRGTVQESRSCGSSSPFPGGVNSK